MKRLLVVLFVLAAISSIVTAVDISEYKINFDIGNDFYVTETIDATFKENVLASNLTYYFNGDIENIVVNGDENKLNFNTEKFDSSTKISPIDSTFIKTISIKFKTKNLIFQLGEKSLFFTEVSTEQNTERMLITLAIPEGSGIADNSYFPENGEVRSDGRRIYIDWSFNNKSMESVTVKFEPLNKGFNIYIPIIISLIIVMLIVYIKLKKRSKEDFMKGFSEDEKKVIEYLEKNPIVYQNKIEQEFKFSRAKMTRISQKFEAKGLIEKRKKGRTNKILYKK
ncbi:MAG: hypothetical protein HY831_00950 [Candidatus Aenigmarchaeota archaeon]|nr:hypothetical protein [Candidatus Aenigmarchaeota archaeon]